MGSYKLLCEIHHVTTSVNKYHILDRLQWIHAPHLYMHSGVKKSCLLNISVNRKQLNSSKDLHRHTNQISHYISILFVSLPRIPWWSRWAVQIIIIYLQFCSLQRFSTLVWISSEFWHFCIIYRGRLKYSTQINCSTTCIWFLLLMLAFVKYFTATACHVSCVTASFL